MALSKRWSVDCVRCENQGLIVLGNDALFPCPICNGWCHFCLDHSEQHHHTRPQRGVLLAGVQRTPDEKWLFKGYVCDHHKAKLRTYSFITTNMLVHFALGDAYIIVQRKRAFVVLYGYGEAANWRTLETDAWQAVTANDQATYGQGCYGCPAEVAERAIASTEHTF